MPYTKPLYVTHPTLVVHTHYAPHTLHAADLPIDNRSHDPTLTTGLTALPDFRDAIDPYPLSHST